MYFAPLKGHDFFYFSEELLRYIIEQMNNCDLCVCLCVCVSSLYCTDVVIHFERCGGGWGNNKMIKNFWYTLS